MFIIETTKGTLAEAASDLSRNSSLPTDDGYQRILDIHDNVVGFEVEAMDEHGRRHHYVLPGHTVVTFH